MKQGAYRHGGGLRIAAMGLIAALAASLGAAAAAAQTSPRPAAAGGPVGVWLDDTGQGAVEIVACGDRLCGQIVWLKDAQDPSGKPLRDGHNPDAKLRQRPICGLQVIGDVARQSNGSWDNGWIYDPKEGKSYDVQLRLRGPDRLEVTGYLGVKFLSESFIWTRAPADLKRCETTSARASAR